MYKSKLEILIVDDSEMIVERLIDLVHELIDVESVKQAGTFSEAYVLIEEVHPDIVFLDINLPDGNGVDLLNKIKKSYPEVKVIMFTNQANDYYKVMCKQLGADYFLDKSCDFESVPQILSSIRALAGTH